MSNKIERDDWATAHKSGKCHECGNVIEEGDHIILVHYRGVERWMCRTCAMFMIGGEGPSDD